MTPSSFTSKGAHVVTRDGHLLRSGHLRVEVGEDQLVGELVVGIALEDSEPRVLRKEPCAVGAPREAHCASPKELHLIAREGLEAEVAAEVVAAEETLADVRSLSVHIRRSGKSVGCIGAVLQVV